MEIHHILADGSETESVEGKILNFHEIPALKRIYEKNLVKFLKNTVLMIKRDIKILQNVTKF